MREAQSIVQGLPDFARLERGLIGRIGAISRIVEFPVDTVLCQQGAAPNSLRYLLDGKAALTQRTSNGTRVIIDLALPVSGLVVASTLADSPYLMTAEALTAAVVLEIAAAPLRRLIATAPSLASAMLRRVSLDSQSATSQVLDLKLRTAAQRLGCYLLGRARSTSGNRAEFHLPVPKSFLAGQLGCRFENLSRAFALLRDVGVETHGSLVVLHDIASLKAYAAPSEGVMHDGDEDWQGQSGQKAARAFSRAFRI